MEDDIISQLEGPKQFWDELNAILVQGERDQDTAQKSIDLYVNIMTKSQDEFLKRNMHLERCCFNLLDSPMFRKFSDKVIERLIYLATTLLDLRQLWMIYNILLLVGKENSQYLKFMLNIRKCNFIPKLKQHISELEQ
ncbi:7668_t:CDS:2, partial [Acaulospora morrowiae]